MSAISPRLFGEVYDFFLIIIFSFNIDSADFFKRLIDPKQKAFPKFALKRATSVGRINSVELPPVHEEPVYKYEDRLLMTCILQDQLYKLFEKHGGYLLIEAPVVDNIDDVAIFDKIYESKGYDLITVCRGPGAINVYKSGKWEFATNLSH